MIKLTIPRYDLQKIRDYIGSYIDAEGSSDSDKAVFGTILGLFNQQIRVCAGKNVVVTMMPQKWTYVWQLLKMTLDDQLITNDKEFIIVTNFLKAIACELDRTDEETELMNKQIITNGPRLA